MKKRDILKALAGAAVGFVVAVTGVLAWGMAAGGGSPGDEAGPERSLFGYGNGSAWEVGTEGKTGGDREAEGTLSVQLSRNSSGRDHGVKTPKEAEKEGGEGDGTARDGAGEHQISISLEVGETVLSADVVKDEDGWGLDGMEISGIEGAARAVMEGCLESCFENGE